MNCEKCEVIECLKETIEKLQTRIRGYDRKYVCSGCISHHNRCFECLDGSNRTRIKPDEC